MKDEQVWVVSLHDYVIGVCSTQEGVQNIIRTRIVSQGLTTPLNIFNTEDSITCCVKGSTQDLYFHARLYKVQNDEYI